MKLKDGTEVTYHCLDNFVAKWAGKTILSGATYPPVPEADDVQVVLDVGANCGAAAVFFARTYPDAVVHAFEPAAAPFEFLERNAGEYPAVRPHPIGLFDRDDEVPLYLGAASAGASSIHPSEFTTEEAETITLRSARAWLAEHGIDRVDICKIDTEGCEVQILTDLAGLIDQMKVIYLEFHSEDDRAAIDELLGPTHDLVSVRQIQSWTGELAFAHRSLLART